jgi:hypothetical protein
MSDASTAVAEAEAVAEAAAAQVKEAQAVADAGAVSEAAVAKKAAETAAAAASTGGEKKLSITQTDLNRMMADNRKKLTQENETLVTSLEELQTTVRLSDSERTSLSDTIESLRKQTLTQDEISKRELAKKQTEFQTTAKRLEEERDVWKERYTGATIGRSLVDAAVQHAAYDPEQITGILGGKTRLVEKTDEAGKAIGGYDVIVDFDTVDSEGKPVTLSLSPAETVKTMKETERFANLFVAKGSAGLGLTGSEQGGSDAPPEDMAAYMEWRKRHPEQIGEQAFTQTNKPVAK